MRQFASDDKEAASAKENLWSQDENGNWRIDPEKDALRMANHTRVYHTKPTYQTVLDCLLYTSPSPRDPSISRMPSSA